MPTRLCAELLQEVMEEARKHRVPIERASRAFFEAYQEHKKITGSLLNHPHYVKEMHDRYRFMKSKAIDYINNEIEKRKARHLS